MRNLRWMNRLNRLAIVSVPSLRIREVTLDRSLWLLMIWIGRYFDLGVVDDEVVDVVIRYNIGHQLLFFLSSACGGRLSSSGRGFGLFELFLGPTALVNNLSISAFSGIH